MQWYQLLIPVLAVKFVKSSGAQTGGARLYHACWNVHQISAKMGPPPLPSKKPKKTRWIEIAQEGKNTLYSKINNTDSCTKDHFGGGIKSSSYRRIYMLLNPFVYQPVKKSYTDVKSEPVIFWRQCKTSSPNMACVRLSHLIKVFCDVSRISGACHCFNQKEKHGAPSDFLRLWNENLQCVKIKYMCLRKGCQKACQSRDSNINMW